MTQTNTHLDNKKLLHRALYRLAAASSRNLGERLAAIYHPEVEWRGSHPFDGINGLKQLQADFWQPLLRAFPDCERRDSIIIGGSYQGRDYVATMGHYCGTWRRAWLGIRASGQPTYLRYGEVHQVRQGLIVQSSVLLDVLDAIRQAGFWPLAPSLGLEGMWPGPITGDGLVLAATDLQQSARSIEQALAMQATLGEHNDLQHLSRAGLLQMPQKRYWHPKMMWYGPSGIGTSRALSGFVDRHQLPFRLAFPNRQGGAQITDAELGGHYVRFGDGNYSVTGGWPSVRAQHTGANFLGTSPTMRPVAMRVMDFYLHHEGKIRENWVPLDILHLLKQMDIDILARVRSGLGTHPPV